MSRRLLVINPNTTVAVSQTLHTLIQAHSPADVEVQTVTARFGAPYIQDEIGYAIATHATVDAWQYVQAEAADASQPQAQAQAPWAGIIIACFGDPGLFALKSCAPCPVIGLAEASLKAAAAAGGSTAIITGGAAWRPMLERLVPHLDQGHRMQGIHTVDLTGRDIHRNPAAAEAVLLRACHEALDRWPVNSLILGGAGLAGLAARLQSQVPVPLIDSVLAASQWIWPQAQPHHPKDKAGEIPKKA